MIQIAGITASLLAFVTWFEEGFTASKQMLLTSGGRKGMLDLPGASPVHGVPQPRMWMHPNRRDHSGAAPIRIRI